MPIATIPGVITRPEHLVEYLALLVEQSELGFEYVAKYDEQMVPRYPACHIQASAIEKTPDGTHTFALTLRALIYIMHANLSASHRVRSLEDLELATKVVSLFEGRDEDSDNFGGLTLGLSEDGVGRVIHGFVESEQPALLPVRKNEAVVGTRLTYSCLQKIRFK